MHRSIPALLMTIMAAFPAGGAWAATHTSAHQGKVTAKHKSTHKYKGPIVDMQWGPVQVTIIVKGKKITNVKASAPTERPRSMIINEQAVPMLRSEVLQAQSADIDEISGATMTSDAFIESLQGALKKAHLGKSHS